MRKKNFSFILLFILSFVLVLDGFASPFKPNSLSYKISPVFEDNDSKLKIILTFKGNKSGQTEIRLPSRFAGQRQLYRGIKNLSVTNKNAVLKNTDKPEIKTIRHKPNERLKIQYELKQYTKGEPRAVRGGGHTPFLRKNYFHFLGNGAWVLPNLGSSSRVKIKLNWKNFPKNWTLANSFGSSKKKQTFSAYIGEFNSAIFVGGDYRIKRSIVEGKPVFTALRGDWKFTDKEFADLVSRVIKSQRDFWNDYDYPYYLVTLLPLKFEAGKSIGGTGLTNSFATFVTNNASINELGWLIAHEHFHNWNPARLGGLEEPEQLLYWFSEGFTDYYTYLLLLRYGLMNFDDYVAKNNEFLKNYSISPAKNENNQRVLKDFFRDRYVGKLPYQRGFFLATKWNHIIRKQSVGKKSLDDVMKDIFRDVKARKFKVLSKTKIVSYLSKYASHDFAGDIEKYVEKGETIDGLENTLGACVKFGKAKIDRYELGFDVKTLQEQRKIAKVKKNSAAYDAGLRDGQKVVGMAIYYNDITKPIKLNLIEDGKRKDVKYMPVAKEKTVIPQFNLIGSLSVSKKRNCLKYFGVN